VNIPAALGFLIRLTLPDLSLTGFARPRFLLVIFILIITLLATTSQTMAQGSAGLHSGLVKVQQPTRAYGYVLGDVIQQRIVLDKSLSVSELTQLPEIQRANAWLQRIAVSANDNDNSLTISYQVTNSPMEPMAISLPSVTLEHASQSLSKVLSNTPANSSQITASSTPSEAKYNTPTDSSTTPLHIASSSIIISPLLPLPLPGDGEFAVMQADQLPAIPYSDKARQGLTCP